MVLTSAVICTVDYQRYLFYFNLQDKVNYRELCDFEVLYESYKEARNGKRSKPGTAQYEANALEYTERLAYLLTTKKYRPSRFEIFTVYEPKKRLVQAPAFVDKVVQHALVDNVLYEAITRSFIRDNHASQTGKGTHVGLKRLKSHMRDYYLKRKGHDEAVRVAAGLPHRPKEEWDYAQGWILKADVYHFFASIEHDIVKKQLHQKVEDPDVYNLMCTYIDTSEGLPLGYQTSQLLALMYLDQFDHWVKEHLHAKYYGRYMDDFYIISDDKQYLQWCRKEIEQYLDNLKLKLNNKTNIFPLQNGIDFLGFHTYLDSDGGVLMKLRQDSIDRCKAKIRMWAKDFPEGKVTKEHIIISWGAWDAHAAHGDTYALRQKIAARVSKIISTRLIARKSIRNTKKDKEREANRKLQSLRKADVKP